MAKYQVHLKRITTEITSTIVEASSPEHAAFDVGSSLPPRGEPLDWYVQTTGEPMVEGVEVVSDGQ